MPHTPNHQPNIDVPETDPQVERNLQELEQILHADAVERDVSAEKVIVDGLKDLNREPVAAHPLPERRIGVDN